ncbi:MAG: hypothetical protein ABFR95_06665 [Actinomycetota bacterium]
MNLWSLEWLRLWRTQRLMILAAVFGSFGLLGPLTVRFLPDLMESLGEEAVGTLPPMTAADGVSMYIGNALQIGILATAFVGAAALAFDAKPEIAIFLRTRAAIRDIFIPRLVVSSAAAAVMFAMGMVIAFVGTGLLIEWIDLGPVLIGTALFMVYLVFLVAVVGLVSSFLRSVPGVALVSVGALIVIGLLSIISPLAPWLPGALIGSTDVLLSGGEFIYWRALIVTSALIAGMTTWSIHRLDHREV